MVAMLPGHCRYWYFPKKIISTDHLTFHFMGPSGDIIAESESLKLEKYPPVAACPLLSLFLRTNNCCPVLHILIDVFISPLQCLVASSVYSTTYNTLSQSLRCFNAELSDLMSWSQTRSRLTTFPVDIRYTETLLSEQLVPKVGIKYSLLAVWLWYEFIWYTFLV